MWLCSHWTGLGSSPWKIPHRGKEKGKIGMSHSSLLVSEYKLGGQQRAVLVCWCSGECGKGHSHPVARWPLWNSMRENAVLPALGSPQNPSNKLIYQSLSMHLKIWPTDSKTSSLQHVFCWAPLACWVSLKLALSWEKNKALVCICHYGRYNMAGQRRVLHLKRAEKCKTSWSWSRGRVRRFLFLPFKKELHVKLLSTSLVTYSWISGHLLQRMHPWKQEEVCFMWGRLLTCMSFRELWVIIWSWWEWRRRFWTAPWFGLNSFLVCGPLLTASWISSLVLV